MEITQKPATGFCTNRRTGERVENDSGLDQLYCDGQCIGYVMGRTPTSNISLIGIPSEALLAALKEKCPGRHIAHPSVLLNKDGDPIDIYGGGDDEEDDDDSPEGDYGE